MIDFIVVGVLIAFYISDMFDFIIRMLKRYIKKKYDTALISKLSVK